MSSQIIVDKESGWASFSVNVFGMKVNAISSVMQLKKFIHSLHSICFCQQNIHNLRKRYLATIIWGLIEIPKVRLYIFYILS